MLFREIKPALWDTDDVPTLAAGEFPARAYMDLRAPDNTLSFWKWDGDDASLRHRLVAALVCKSGTLRPFAFVVLNEADLQNAGCEVSPKKGETFDTQLNDHHVDAIELSGSLTYAIGKLILDASQAALEQLEEEEVLSCIKFSNQNGFLTKAIPKPIFDRLADADLP